MNRRSLIIFTVIIAIAFFVAFFLLYLTTSKKQPVAPPLYPTPTQIETNENVSFPDSINAGSQTTIDYFNHSFLVGKLVNKLPHKGNDFSFSYDSSKNIFLLSLNEDNSNAANAEFDDYLRQNGISNRSWFENLSIVLQKTSPQP